MRSTPRALLILTLSGTLALASCTVTIGDPERTGASPAPAGSSPSSADEPVAPDAKGMIAAPGRLAVVGADGTLSTMRPDGAGRTEMPQADGRAVQPAWSPQGDRLAWVVQLTSGTGVGGAIIVAGPRGERPIVTRTPFLPYYLSWDPTGDRVAFLGAGGDPEMPVEMGVLDLTDDRAKVRTVSGGEPFFYFAWAPDGRRVLAHAGFDRLDEVDLAGNVTNVSRRPGLFATPAWSADGRTMVYAERAGGNTQRLIAIVDGGRPRVLVEGAGTLSFVLRPDGGAVAYQLLGADDGDLFDRRPTHPGDGVRVVDVRSGVTKRATEIRAITFWWSPDGTRLLTLAPEPASAGTIPFRWQVWEGSRAIDVEGSHSPTIDVLRDYAPFFTQYAQSTTPWAPDASAFAYPVQAASGRGLIVVQEVGGEPIPVAEGVYVTWSP
jgi:hypothetical protein